MQSSHGGRKTFKYDPTTAPAMVSGSMTSMMSQSMRGRSAEGWRFRALRMQFARELPRMVTLESGIAICATQQKPI